MSRNKYLLIALTVVFSIIMVTGCSQPTEAPVVETPVVEKATEVPAPATEVVAPATEVVAPVTEDLPFAGTTLTYIASQDWIKDPELELAKMFEEETGAVIDYQIIPSDQYFNVLQTKLEAGGEGIDIFGGQSGKTDIKLQLNVEKNAVPLTDQEWVSRMNPLSVEQVSLDGVTYGLTIWDTIGGSWVVVYNKSAFADNGINIPTSYAEFATASQTLKDAGITPVYEPFADGWHHVLWFLEMGPAYEAATPGLADALNANTATFTGNAAMTTALTEIKEMYDNGYFGEDALSDEFANTEASMASGNYAMTLNRFGLPSQINAAFPDVAEDNFGFFLLPIADNQIWNVNPAGPSKFIYSGSKNIEAAKAYFEFLTRPENLQYMLDNEPQFTMLSFEGVSYELTAEQQAFLDTYKTQGTVYQTAVNYTNPQWMDVGQDLTALVIGDMTPEDVVASIDQRRTDMAIAANDPAWK
jgi:raffinose/stachyose/melibiose transport system substrate-binding protein